MAALTPTNSRPNTPNHSLRPNFYTSSPTPTAPSSNGTSLASASPSHGQTTFKESRDRDTPPTMRHEPTPPARPERNASTIDKHIIPPPQTLESLLPVPVPNHVQKDLPTPSSTPTTSRKTRRRSNLFTPSKKNDDDKKNKNGEMGSGRAIPIKQGYLYKRSLKTLNKEWKKKYVTLCDDGRLTYHPSLHDYMDDVHGKDIPLIHTTVKIPGQKPRSARSQPSSSSSVNGLSSEFSTVTLGNTDSDGFEFVIVSLDNKQWHFEASNTDEREAWVQAIEQQILTSLQSNESTKTKSRSSNSVDPASLQMIRSTVRGNTHCADCDAPAPDWASLNLGIVLCIECSGIHRNLGSHISRVRSLDLDEWAPGPLSVMLALGNSTANKIWESVTRGRAKPTPNSSREEKERWIRAKYELKEFVQPLPTNAPVTQQLIECVCKSDVTSTALVLANAQPEQVNGTVSGRDLRNPLHLACGMGSLPIVQLLLWNHTCVKATDQDGRTAIVYARASANQEIQHLLLQNGCPEPAPVSNTLPRRKGSISRNQPDVFDKLPASII